MYDIFVNKHVCNINHVHERLRLRHSSRWLESMQSKPELRTYATFKKEYETETFIEINLTSQRSYMAQFRCGILPLRMETGRFVGEEIEDCVCNLRNKNKIVDGLHFVLSCPLYDNLRDSLLSNIDPFLFINNMDLINHLIKSKPRKMSKYIESAMKLRRSVLYK